MPRGAALPPEVAHVHRLHLRFTVLEALALGVLANAPVVALRTLGSPPWQLALGLVPSSLGIVLDLYFGGRMAHRSKLPYIRGALVACATAVALMATVTTPLIFNLLLGLGALGQVLAQMALTPVLRMAYPADRRGALTGSARRWHSLAQLAAALATALWLDQADTQSVGLARARALLVVAVLILLVAAWSIGHLPVTAGDPQAPVEGLRTTSVSLKAILKNDHRYRAWLGVLLLAGCGNLMVAPYVNALLVKQLSLGFLPSLGVSQLLPQLLAFLTTPWWGRTLDVNNPWRVLGWTRVVWGLSFVLLAVVAGLVTSAPSVALAVAVASRALFGAVMGGSWILYWQLGVTYFAPLGADTSRYMSLTTAVAGLGRLIGPGLGALVLLFSGTLSGVFALGGLLSLVGSALSFRHHRAERRQSHLLTMARFEASLSPRPEARGPLSAPRSEEHEQRRS